MKKVIATVLCSMFMFIAGAQEHLEFKGIPLDGKTSEFVKKLTDAGFKYLGREDGSDIFTGTFTGKNCTVIIESTPITNTVYSAFVILDQERDWATLKSDYSMLKKGLTAKYGEPYEFKEEYKGTLYKEGDGFAYSAFKGGYVDWYAYYKTTLGQINLYIREQSSPFLTVIVNYVDDKNQEKAIQELTEDL